MNGCACRGLDRAHCVNFMSNRLLEASSYAYTDPPRAAGAVLSIPQDGTHAAAIPVRAMFADNTSSHWQRRGQRSWTQGTGGA